MSIGKVVKAELHQLLRLPGVEVDAVRGLRWGWGYDAWFRRFGQWMPNGRFARGLQEDLRSSYDKVKDVLRPNRRGRNHDRR